MLKLDEIRIMVKNADSYTLPRKNHYYGERKGKAPTDDGVNEFYFTNNGMAFLFSKIQYELNGVQLQKI